MRSRRPLRFSIIVLVLIASTPAAVIAGALQFAGGIMRLKNRQARMSQTTSQWKQATASVTPDSGVNASLVTLVEFTGNGPANKGWQPNGLILGRDGNFYGTTGLGGAYNYGTIFKMTPKGALTTLVEFAGKSSSNASGLPAAPLLEARDGNFYGTTSGGGINERGETLLDHGTIFKMSPAGVLTTLVRFSDNGPADKGATPYAGVVEGPDGQLYGPTFAGGTRKVGNFPGGGIGLGTIYKVTTGGALTTLFDFSTHMSRGEGGGPWGGLVLGRDGKFYGTTWTGRGTIFKVTPNGGMSTLVRFSFTGPPHKGGGCEAELLQAHDGNFYGVTPVGGAANRGTIFKLTPSGAFSTLVEFTDNDPERGALPVAGLVEDADGTLYGTTTTAGANGAGTLFQVMPSGRYQTILSFPAEYKGTTVKAALVKYKTGDLYGTTTSCAEDVPHRVFRVTMGTAPTTK